MPIVKMPDGTQVRFPDDMPREQIRDMIASKFPDAAKSAPAVNADAGFDPMRDLPIPGTTHPGRPPAEPSMVPWLDPITAFANNAVDSVPVAGPTLTNMRQNADAVVN